MCKNKNFNLATKAKGLILKISKVFSGQTLLMFVFVLVSFVLVSDGESLI